LKKTLVAAAAFAAAAGGAWAQSSVTLFGVTDVGVRHVSNSGGGNVTQVVSGGLLPSRLGMRGVEDLGGGLKATFWLESQLNVDSGSGVSTNSGNTVTAPASQSGGLTFNRRSTVGLIGDWGEVRLGRDLAPQFLNPLYFDPFGVTGLGTSQTQNSVVTGQTAVRVSNAVEYLLPAHLHGVYGNVVAYAGENQSNSANAHDGEGYAGRLGYASGHLDVAVAASRTRYAAGDAHQFNAGAAWDFGLLKLTGLIVRDRLGTLEGRGGLVGAIVPVPTGEVRLAWSRYRTSVGAGPLSTKFALGYVHNLSKRTALYADLGAVHNSNGAAASVASGAGAPAANQGSRGFTVGVKHSF